MLTYKDVILNLILMVLTTGLLPFPILVIEKKIILISLHKWLSLVGNLLFFSLMNMICFFPPKQCQIYKVVFSPETFPTRVLHKCVARACCTCVLSVRVAHACCACVLRVRAVRAFCACV